MNNFDPSKRTLFVVGDEKQCIYGFRGSRVDLILQFHKFYPKVKEIVLNQNYRSTQPILDMAEKIISHNKNQKTVGLFTANPQNHIKVKYYLARNEKDEANYIIKSLQELYCSTDDIKLDSYSDDKRGNNNENEDEISFVPDEEEYKKETKTNDTISSMFDIYMDASNETTSIGKDIWGGLTNNSYNPSSWQLKEIDWSNCQGLNDSVVLYRTHAQSRAIEEALLKQHVPYKLVSGTRFLDRKEVKDVLAILKFCNNGNDKMALSRFLPLVLPGVGAKTMEKIYNFMQDPDFPLPKRHLDMVEDVLTQIGKNFERHSNLIDFTKNLIEDIGYNTYLKGEYTNKEEFISRSENIAEIYSLMLQFDHDTKMDLSDRLNLFLEHVMLISNVESKENNLPDNSPKISLMTLHQSKGLEFETVFLVGLEEGILPHQNSLMDAVEIEEEVRLAYVGVTRAKKNLFLLAADSRVQFGQVKANPVSRIFRPFLDSHAKRVN